SSSHIVSKVASFSLSLDYEGDSFILEVISCNPGLWKRVEIRFTDSEIPHDSIDHLAIGS
ncbi:hypothetical protein LINGRAHAP2_LOCUS19973, partial [Linum grandiflorum]